MRIRPLVLALLLPTLARALTYDVTDLGTLPGDSVSEAFAVNADDQVAGNSLTFLPHAFVWSAADGLVPLGDLGGADPNSSARDVSDTGVVVGTSSSPAGLRAYRWSAGGGLEDLGTLPGYAWSGAHGVSASGVVVGELSNVSPTGPRSGFRLDGGTMEALADLVTPHAASSAVAVNEGGQLAGWIEPVPGQRQAFRMEPDGTLTLLGTLGGDESEARAIAPDGTVVGYSTLPGGGRRAFSWSESTGMVNLGGLGGDSEALGIDARGTVVGEAGPAGGGRPTAFVARGGDLVDLGDLLAAGSGWFIESARDIGDSGAIVGKGFLGAASRAVLLTPRPPAFTLGPLDPGLPGGESTVTVTGAPPGAAVNLFYSTSSGLTLAEGVCPGAALELSAPRPLPGSPAIADAAGTATLVVPIPPGAAGRTIHLQAVVPSTCGFSAAIVQTLP